MTTPTARTPTPVADGRPREHVELVVGGMHCVSCASRVERVLSHQAGVTEASVNFATRRADVVLDPEATELEQLEAAVDRKNVV